MSLKLPVPRAGQKARIVVPMTASAGFLTFFPRLDVHQRNPSCEVVVLNAVTQSYWTLNYTYYNGTLHGHSSKNEYRLSRLSSMLQAMGATEGSFLSFDRTADGEILVSLDSTSLGSELSSKAAFVPKKTRGGFTIIEEGD